ncbi:MAG TPA: MMPL family transporter [Actinomycetota bacterium]|nr:MMPL family transporter [Actinomycetota bacterium]
MSRFLYRLGMGAARRRWLTLGVWIAAVIAIFAAGNALGGALKDDFNLPDSESQRAYDLLAERFPAASGTSAFIVFETGEGSLADRADEVGSALERIGRQPHVVGVTNPLEIQGTVSPDGTIGYAQVSYDRTDVNLGTEPWQRLVSAVERARAPGLRVEIGGEYAAWGSQSEPGSSELIGLLAAMIILLIAFGSVVAMGLPIATAVIGLATGTGIVLILSAFVSVPEFSTILASMIGLGVGIDYALFIVTRYRQNLHSGMEPLHAIGLASATAGQAVVFAGTTVALALLGLWISGIAFVGMMATAAAIVVVVAVIAAVTLLPALLGFAGRAIDKLSVHRRGREVASGEVNIWGRWGREVERHPWRYFAGAILVLVALALPLFSMEMGFPDDGTAPTSETRRQAYDLLSEGFGPGFNGPLLLAVEIDDPAALPGLERLTSAIASTEGVAAVTPPQRNEAGDAAIIRVIPTTSPQDPATTDLVQRLRDEAIPRSTPEGAVVHVGGATATFIDLSERVTNALPWFIGAVVLLSFLLLVVVFRSILVPLKAALLNLLSIGAAYGVIVMIFQWGWGRSLLGLEQSIPVVSFVPMMMFAVLFGLSMDYEVFLLSRVREDYLRTGNNVESVVTGISSTARVITSAALIMIAVFLSFVTQPDPIAKMFGVGLAFAVLIDATIVRVILVPATMVLLGDANWWLPGWLDRILPRMQLELAEEPEEPERVLVA